ncbi:PAS domain S-box protein [Terasakiella sp. SH-1]|uniref:PAS domain S-box protein n=1 Tax=Terasakiella sp. SH-1 TaxID=2560057 RepID=UPI0010748EB1|nr:PAS domain S-box protein [Terasakiella sp. SH-1]
MKQDKNLAWQLMPVQLLAAIVFAGAVFFLFPYLSQKNAEDQAISTAGQLAHQVKTLRAYYTNNVVSKVMRGDNNITVSADHMGKDNVIPLPASMVNDLGDLSKGEQFNLSFYSPYPFWKNKRPAMDAFNQNAWAALNQNPGEPYAETVMQDGQHIIRVAIADTMASKACVECHNTHPESPKTDWKMGDVRGVVEVSANISQAIIQSQLQGLYLALAMVAVFGGIILISFRKTLAQVDQWSSDLQVREEDLEKAQAIAKVGSWKYERTANQIHWSDEIYRLIGVNKQMVLPSYATYKEAIHPEDLDFVRGQYLKSLSGGYVYDLEYRIVRQDDQQVIWVHEKCEHIFNEAGDNIFSSGTIQDITERVHAKKALIDSAQRSRTIVDMALDGIITINAKGIIISANNAAEQLFGYSQQELVGQNISLIVPAPYKDSHDDYIQRYLETKEANVVGRARDVFAQRRDGTPFPVRLAVSEVMLDDDLHFVGIISDRSAQKAAEEHVRSLLADTEVVSQIQALSLTSKSLKDILNEALELILKRDMLDLLGMGAVFLYEEDSDELVMVAERDLHPAVKAQCSQLALGSCLCGKAAQTGQAIFKSYIDEDHTNISVENMFPHGHACIPLKYEEKLLGVLNLYLPDGVEMSEKEELLIRNVAATLAGLIQRKKTEQKHLIAKEKAELSSRVKSEFLASMSHELRTPMTGVIGFADLLLEDDLNEESKDKVHRIKSSTNALLRVVNDILDMSKLEAGKMEVEDIDFHLRSLVEDVHSMFALKRRKDTAVTSRIEFSEDFPDALHSDPTRIRQVLLNLLGNAFKFTHEGEILLRAELSQSLQGEPVVKFSVRDTGIGMDDETLDRLFHNFTQADASISRKYEGTGLGLAISKRLVELMGGNIGVDSTVGEGSTFWFTIPYEEVQTEVKPEKQEVQASKYKAVRHLNVLLAEDNRVNQLIIQKFLAAYGHTVTIAQNGLEVLDLLVQNEAGFDLILMDVRMPEMDGTEATRHIRAQSTAQADIPIIAVTADAVKENIDGYFEAGVNGYVSKPLNWLELITTMDKVLGEEVHIPKE